MNDAQQKAQKIKIASEFCDACTGKHYTISDDVINFFSKRLYDEAELRWQTALEPIYIREQNNLIIDVVSKTEDIKISNYDYEVIGIIETHKTYNKYNVAIKADLSVGYYDIDIVIEGKKYKTTLAVAPSCCYSAANIKDKKIWGLSVQLYSLRSKSNWGVGDFSDLKKLAEISAKKGVDVIGINPINVLTHKYPEDASPYSATSRLFINPIYIDVTKTKGYTKELIKDINIQELQNIDIIDYTKVFETKMSVLKKIYKTFIKSPCQEFINFCNQKGQDLDNLATFEALSQKYDCNWRTWDKALQNPHSKDVQDFKKKHQENIGFYKFLQYEADRQFKDVEAFINKSKMSIGLYRDLAVGVGQCSAEMWSNQDVFIKDAGAGAPPDMFFPKGQGWGLGAFNPYILKQQKYMPMRNVLRANMAYAGALRIDHVMRLFVIPNKFEDGTYIYYNFEDMINILAIESVLNKCTIVGESIGNVPDGFLDMLNKKNIAPISVLWAEKYDCGWGDFKNPNDYPKDAYVSISTHDMPPLRMWWFGKDIILQRKLDIIQTDEDMGNAFKKREEDRWKLLKVLDNNGLWPQDNPRFADYLYGEDYPEGIEEAAHNLLAKSNSKGALICLEDILQVEKQQNLPGTDRDQYPNWRRKLPINIEDLDTNNMFVRNMELYKQGR